MTNPHQTTNAPSQPPNDATKPSSPPSPNGNTIATTYTYDEDIPYPRPGNGIVLPPESADLEWLIDDDYETFSHTVLGVPVRMREVLLMGGSGAMTGTGIGGMAGAMEMGVGNAMGSGMQGQGQGQRRSSGVLSVGA